MKIIKSDVSTIPQEPGVIGMYKLIEKAARVSYKSEDKITDDSYLKFIDMIYNRGHWAVFNLGTVYLSVPMKQYSNELDILGTKPYSKYTMWNMKDGKYLITTDYRVICQTGLQNEMIKFWSEPTPEHYHRIATHWICSRSISQEVMRHRVMSFCQESTRYINYHRDKFGKELTYILPQWVYRIRDSISKTIDSLTGESREYIKDLDGEELWKCLCTLDRTVASRDNYWKEAENEYMYEITTDEGESLTAEEARDALPLGVKTEFFMTGFVSDFTKVPKENSSEKCGFFYLRCAKDAHPDIRILANKLKDEFKEKEIYYLK